MDTRNLSSLIEYSILIGNANLLLYVLPFLSVLSYLMGFSHMSACNIIWKFFLYASRSSMEGSFILLVSSKYSSRIGVSKLASSFCSLSKVSLLSTILTPSLFRSAFNHAFSINVNLTGRGGLPVFFIEG
jgi:hypothetical protein